MSHNFSHNSAKRTVKNGNISENGFSQHEDNVGFSYGQDFDEMEFLQSTSPIKNPNTTNEALIGKYTRTRKNLGQKMSADAIIENGPNKKTKKQFSSTSFNTKTKNFTLKPSAEQASVAISPMTNIISHKATKSSASITKAGSDKDTKLSLLDMVKKFSMDTSHASLDASSCKTASSKANSSLAKFFNIKRNEPPKTNSVNNGSLQSLVPDSIEISLVPSTSKGPSKNSNSCIDDFTPNKKKRVKKLCANPKKLEKNSVSFELASCSKKRSSEVTEIEAKKCKKMENENSCATEDAIYGATLGDGNKTDVATAVPINDMEMSFKIDRKRKEEEAESLRKNRACNVNTESQVLPLNSNLGNGSILNTIQNSYVISSAVESPLSNAIVPSNINNNTFYDVNSCSLYPPIAVPQTTVFIVPVATSFSAIPNTPGGMTQLNPSQPPIKVTCNGMDADAVFKTICNNFFQTSQPSIQNSNVYSDTNRTIVGSNSLIHTSLNASSSTLTQQLETCSNNLLIPDARTDSEFAVREVSTSDRSSLLLGYFCELMKNRPKLSLEQYKKQANEILDLLSSFPHYLSVKYFYNNAEEYFSEFCFCSAPSRSTSFKFEEHFQELRLNEVLKQYVSFHVKEIMKHFSCDPFCVKSNLIFKAQNSKLTYFEKLILKKMLKSNQEVDMKDLIGRLFFVGLVVILCELKKIG